MALLERSRHALNGVLYRPSKDVVPTATTEGLNMPAGIDPHSSFLEHFLRGTFELQQPPCNPPTDELRKF